MEWADVEMELDASGHEDLAIWCNDEVARMRGALMLARAAHISRTWDDVALAAIDSALTPNAPELSRATLEQDKTDAA